MSKTNFSCWCSSRSAAAKRCTLYCMFASIYLHSNKQWRLQKRAIEFISKLNNCFSCLSCLSHAFMHIFLPLLNEIIRISSAFSLSQLDCCSTAASNKQNKKRTHRSNDNRQSSNETLAIGNNDCSKAVALASTAEMNARHQDEMGRGKIKQNEGKKYNKQ